MTVHLVAVINGVPVPVAARSKALVCGRWPAEWWVIILPGAWMSVVIVVSCQVEVSAMG